MPFGKAFLTRMHDNTVKKIRWGAKSGAGSRSSKLGGVGGGKVAGASSIISPQSSIITPRTENSSIM